MRRLVLLAVALAVVASAPGCKRGTVIKDDKTFDLEPTVPHALYIPPCKKFDVHLSTTGNVPINVYIMSKEDGDESIKASSVKGKKLAIKENAFADRVSFTGADKEMAVVFESRKKTTVTAKISGE